MRALKAEHQLLELDLSYNPGLGRESYEQLASYPEHTGSGLRVLRLEGNSAGDKLCELMHEALVGHAHLRQLDISRNRITDVGAENLSDALFYNSSIQVF